MEITTPDVRIRCEVDVAHTDENGWRSSKSEDESKSFYLYGNSYNGTVEIAVLFYQKAVRISLNDVICKIVSVY